MKKLKCEMCGSTDFIKEKGVFACQNCGIKYSVGDAKKMVTEVASEDKDRVEIAQENNVANYLAMAQSAYHSQNYKEAESYCNKILEIDLQNYEAWFLKGKSAGWQSTKYKKRLNETVSCFEKAIKYSPESVKKNIANDSLTEIMEIAKALVSLCCRDYENLPDENHKKSIMSAFDHIFNNIHNIIDICAAEHIDISKEACNQQEFAMVQEIYFSTLIGWNKILHDFSGKNKYPDRFDYEGYKENAVTCIELLDYIEAFIDSTFNKNKKHQDSLERKIVFETNENNSLVVSQVLQDILNINHEKAKEIVDAGVIEDVNFDDIRKIKNCLEFLDSRFQIFAINKDGMEIEEDFSFDFPLEIKTFLLKLRDKQVAVCWHYMNAASYKMEYTQYGNYFAIDCALPAHSQEQVAKYIFETHLRFLELSSDFKDSLRELYPNDEIPGVKFASNTDNNDINNTSSSNTDDNNASSSNISLSIVVGIIVAIILIIVQHIN